MAVTIDVGFQPDGMAGGGDGLEHGREDCPAGQKPFEGSHEGTIH